MTRVTFESSLTSVPTIIWLSKTARLTARASSGVVGTSSKKGSTISASSSPVMLSTAERLTRSSPTIAASSATASEST